MSTLFVHDHKFRRINGALFSSGGLNDVVLTRYTDIFGHTIVVGRILDESEIKGNYSRITNPGIEITTGADLAKKVSQADAVIARLPSINGYKAVGHARRLGKPYLVEVVGCTWDAYWNYGLKGKLLALPAYCVMRYMVSSAPYTVYVTRQFLQRRYPTLGTAAGISDVILEETDERVLSNRLLRINGRRPTLRLGTAAAVDVAYKGHEYIIAALPMIEERLGCMVEYLLAGAGSQERLRRIADSHGVPEKVVFMGTLPHRSVSGWLDGLDIYIQPSRLEGLSRALIEAMSRGLPCLASNVGGNPELLAKECLFSVDKPDRIAEEVCGCVVTLCGGGEMAKQANRNFAVANTDYDNKHLSQIRNGFYAEFRADALKKAGRGT